MFKSIRSRLALSFAAIALVAAVVLGAVLLVILQDYYLRLEFDYLRGNAKFVSSLVVAMTSDKASHDEVQSQIENLAFLTQTRIQVFDTNQQLLYDSGSPMRVNVNFGVMKQMLARQPNGNLPSNAMRVITVNGNPPGKLPPLEPSSDLPSPDSNVLFVYRSVQASGSPFGFDLNAETLNGGPRSPTKFRDTVMDPKSGTLLGTLILSDGPAYGRAILTSVAWGWTLASTVAVLFAIGVGWFISRRISAPVLALTHATTQMANGDLSSRANISSRDEFGTLARSFNEMADQVETTVNALRRFASDAAHELNSPLTALRTDLDLAVALSEEQPRAMIERAQATVNRLEELNRNLLDLSRIEAAHNAGAKETAPIDLVDEVRQLSEVYASQAEQAEIMYQVDLPDSPIIVQADAKQIQRAIGNLIENALKFTPPKGSVRVQVSQAENAASISVSDTGIGIPIDDVPQLFNRFHRGRNATAFAGSGLGLAIVKAIAEQNGAEVSAENLTTGARFTLRWKMLG
ncbi:MAG: HAMP domain-containing histidine kinase [Chloroflexi bacterium]|nr:HAMP domain-containing histidine kinase [Chloroflexota bacterium]